MIESLVIHILAAWRLALTEDAVIDYVVEHSGATREEAIEARDALIREMRD